MEGFKSLRGRETTLRRLQHRLPSCHGGKGPLLTPESGFHGAVFNRAEIGIDQTVASRSSSAVFHGISHISVCFTAMLSSIARATIPSSAANTPAVSNLAAASDTRKPSPLFEAMISPTTAP